MCIVVVINENTDERLRVHIDCLRGQLFREGEIFPKVANLAL
jgi:hypothetical protein